MPIRLTTSRHAVALALGLAALITIGCSDSSKSPARPLGIPPATAAPIPDTPVNTVQLFKWCWENRDIAHYREILPADFNFTCPITDTAGNAYRNPPWAWTREDELISFSHMCAGGSAYEPAASSISLIFDGNLIPQNDRRDGKSANWHQQVQIANLTLTIIRSDGSAFRLTGGALFYLVRGDSAAIPQELVDLGFKPDPGRWFIEHWEDQTNIGALPPSEPAGNAAANPAMPLPARRITWCQIKAIYR